MPGAVAARVSLHQVSLHQGPRRQPPNPEQRGPRQTAQRRVRARVFSVAEEGAQSALRAWADCARAWARRSGPGDRKSPLCDGSWYSGQVPQSITRCAWLSCRTLLHARRGTPAEHWSLHAALQVALTDHGWPRARAAAAADMARFCGLEAFASAWLTPDPGSVHVTELSGTAVLRVLCEGPPAPRRTPPKDPSQHLERRVLPPFIFSASPPASLVAATLHGTQAPSAASSPAAAAGRGTYVGTLLGAAPAGNC